MGLLGSMREKLENTPDLMLRRFATENRVVKLASSLERSASS